MVKLLVVGSIQSQWALLQNKLASLHASSHGPFDLCLCAGSFFQSAQEYEEVAPALALPLPTYVLDRTGLPSDEDTLPRNLHLLPSMGSVTVAGLSIACMGRHMKRYAPGAYERLAQSPEEVMYFQGYDVLLTADWPRNVSNGVSTELQLPTGEEDASQLACRLRPRYHFTSSGGEEAGGGVFYQRPPYTNCGTSSSSSATLTRFIGMAGVSASKDKTRKWIHALSLDPSSTSSPTPSSSSSTPCPYAPSPPLRPPPPPPPPSAAASSVGLKRKLEDTVRDPTHGQGAGSLFFGAMGVPRPGEGNRDSIYGPGERSGQKGRNLQPPSAEAKTLFVGGLTPQIREKDLSEGFGGNVVQDVRLPPGKNFAFVEFVSHQAALAVVAESQSTMGVSVKGRPVSIGWATGSSVNSISSTSGSSKYSDPPSATSCSLFIGGLLAWSASVSADSGAGGSSSACTLTKSQLEAALLGLFPGSVEVHLLEGKSYAFVDFSSHTAAAEVMRQYVENNGAFVLPGAVREKEGEGGEQEGSLTVGWAQGKPQRRAGPGQGRGEYDNSASHNADCWFCLASSTIKVHLIVAVGEAMYVSLPRGGVVDGHALLIPIECVSTRGQLPAAATRDLLAYESALERMHASRGLSCLRFERALRTQGQRNHMQVHVVPLTAEQVQGAVQVFLALCSQYQVHFHEITDCRVSIEEFLVNLAPSASSSGGGDSEYFCIEIPYGDDPARHLYRRFVYVPPPSEGKEKGREREKRGQQRRFPMHFGTEAAARMIGQPERANWKNCVQSEQQETKLTEEFRAAFQEVDPFAAGGDGAGAGA